MIAFLQGILTQKLDGQIILVNHGIGYAIRVSNSMLSAAPEGTSMEIFIATRITDETMVLYGFTTLEEMNFFHQLIKISGIGPKTAMSILDTPLPLLQKAILEEDVEFLSTIPGIGKKTAARLILELKGKALPSGIKAINSVQEEALQALVGLGYEKPVILRFLNGASFSSAEEIVKNFLQQAS